ncbi:MAG: TGc protein [Dehalococcoidia bacterium]|nr:TGc protein [Dehalococcoidia bacterium]
MAAIDQYALAAPDSAEQSIKALASYLVSPAQDDFEKARAIYRWVTGNISYDFAAYLSKSYGDQSAEAVLKRRTGVCGGYANLFQALGKAAGLQVEVVEGLSKGYGYVNNQLDKEPNHAWNAAHVNGLWYLVDSTWGSGTITEAKEFERRFDDYYFLVLPQQLIYTHIPTDPRWQLLTSPVTQEQFLALPRVWPRFFESGLGLLSHRSAIIQTSREVDVTLSVPPTTLLIASLHRGGVTLADSLTFVQPTADGYLVRAVFPEAGEYALTIYTKLVGEEGAYFSTLEYTVNVVEGDLGHPGFPRVWPAFFENQIGFVSHSGGTISVARELVLTLSAPVDVLILANLSRDGQDMPDSQTFVQREGADYAVRAAFPSAGQYELTIFSKRAGAEGLYDSTLSYTVQVSEGSPGLSYPKTYASFHNGGAVLYSPFSGSLSLGSTQSFRLLVPDAERVAVIIDEQWHYLEGTGGVFQGNVTIDGRDIGVYAQFPGDAQFSGLIEYTAS